MQTPEVLCLGEALIDIFPEEPGGSIIKTGKMVMSASGAPAIVAACLARLGTPTGFVGRVGADFFGYHLKDALVEQGVDATLLRFDTGAATGLAFVNYNERGDAVYLFYRNPSADMLLQPADIEPEYVSQAKVLQFGSLLLAAEPSGAATWRAIEIAREAGLILSYDLNLRLAGWPDEQAARAGTGAPMEYATIVKLNRHELLFLTGENDLEAGTAKLWRDNFKLVVITLDKEGCFYRNSHATGYVPGYPAKVVDTVGAGDAFMAGLLDGLRRGDFDFENVALIKQACRQGCAAGALMVTRLGAIPALPSREEVDQFLKNGEVK